MDSTDSTDAILHAAVAATARTRPTAVAIRDGDRTLTYRELDSAADAWAARLVEAGVRVGDRVPVLLPRGAELVTALLAVLKAGAAYALLDPGWPVHRLREIADILAAPLLIAAPGHAPDLGIPVSPPGRAAVSAPAGFRPAGVPATHPCCVFFTSGTSGRPKGVLTTHQATARLFRPGTFARFAPDTVIPLAAPPPWDAFSLELWGALLSGGTALVVGDPYLSVRSLRAGVAEHGVDTVWLTSSLFNMIVDEDAEAFRGLRQVLTGGERLSAGHVRRFLRSHPDVTLVNGYGPVESTVFATTHVVTAEDCLRPDGIPIGRPVPGTRVHVLDGLRTCAPGEVGEICVSGEGLALGYLGDPGLTAEKFVRVPLPDGEDLVYRTGDLGVLDVDGLLHFRGRADRQLKIRGHRIEPAEVERQIEDLLPRVGRCRVLGRADDTGNTVELIAFCVPAEPDDPLDGLLPALHRQLVSYHRPTALVRVDGFPLTPQGKLDERALLASAAAVGPPRGSPSSAPPGPDDGDGLLRLVADTFGAVLGLDAVPRDASFVDLGGRSLDAGRICARLELRLARPVPVSRLHQAPTVAAFTDWLRSPDTPGSLEGLPEPADGVPLRPMQIVHLTRHIAEPEDRTGHCLLTWVVEGAVDLDALESAVAAVHERHGALQAAYVPDPVPRAVPADLGAPPLEVLAPQASGDAGLAALRTELSGPLEILGGDVWRTIAAPVGDGSTTVFGCAVHHIAFDGWSEAVLAAELSAAYNAARGTGPAMPAPPPGLPARHAEAVRRRRTADAADRLEKAAAELTGVPLLRWPGTPSVRTGTPRRIEVAIPRAVLADVDVLAASLGVSRFVVLFHRFAACLAQVTGQRDFAVGVPAAHRDGPHLDGVIDCQITMLCIRMRAAALEDDDGAIRLTAERVADALAGQDISFPDLLGRLDPPSDGRPPVFQTLFALQDNAPPELRLDGLRTEFRRQPYLDLPLELHAEIWPDERGGARLEIAYRPGAVADETAEELAGAMSKSLQTTDRGATP